jgi:hypothetical protein
MTTVITNSYDTTGTHLIAHPDKIEIFIQNSARNIDLLPEEFPQLRKKWTGLYGFTWRHQRDTLNHEWIINAWNDHFRITFTGNLRDIENNPKWEKNPFSGQQLWNLYRNHPYWYFGKIRITDRIKTDPAAYMAYVSDIFRDIEVAGLAERPRIIECAIDVYGDAEPFRNSVRLVKDDPFQLCHYKDDQHCTGGSKSGLHTEYSMHPTFQPRRADTIRKSNRYHRELACYPKPEHGMYRIELRLGYRYLRRFYDSRAYHTAIEAETIPALDRKYVPSLVSRTLDLIGFLPYFVRTQLKWEAIALEKLYKYHPNSRYWHLAGKSVRQVRYKLSQAGFTRKQMDRFTIPLPRPRITFLLPRQFTTQTNKGR